MIVVAHISGLPVEETIAQLAPAAGIVVVAVAHAAGERTAKLWLRLRITIVCALALAAVGGVVYAGAAFASVAPGVTVLVSRPSGFGALPSAEGNLSFQ